MLGSNNHFPANPTRMRWNSNVHIVIRAQINLRSQQLEKDT